MTFYTLLRFIGRAIICWPRQSGLSWIRERNHQTRSGRTRTCAVDDRTVGTGTAGSCKVTRSWPAS